VTPASTGEKLLSAIAKAVETMRRFMPSFLTNDVKKSRYRRPSHDSPDVDIRSRKQRDLDESNAMPIRHRDSPVSTNDNGVPVAGTRKKWRTVKVPWAASRRFESSAAKGNSRSACPKYDKPSRKGVWG
jgi:hypothetical protein